jgi:hypothetical protein
LRLLLVGESGVDHGLDEGGPKLQGRDKYGVFADEIAFGGKEAAQTLEEPLRAAVSAVHEVLHFRVSVGQDEQTKRDAILVVAVEDALVVLGRPGAFKEGGESVVVVIGKKGRVVAERIAE